MYLTTLFLMVQWPNEISHVLEICANINIHSLTRTPFTLCGNTVGNKRNESEHTTNK